MICRNHMNTATCAPQDHLRRNERRSRQVIALTLAMMIIEISAGTLFGSMATIESSAPKDPVHYRDLLTSAGELSHVTIEVNRRSKRT